VVVPPQPPRPTVVFPRLPPRPAVVVTPPSSIPKVVIIPPAPQLPHLKKQIETGNFNHPLKNRACFYMKSAQNGQTVSFGNTSMEITLSKNQTPNEVVCVENGPNNAYFIH
jgi:hypothetical protein